MQNKEEEHEQLTSFFPRKPTVDKNPFPSSEHLWKLKWITSLQDTSPRLAELTGDRRTKQFRGLEGFAGGAPKI